MKRIACGWRSPCLNARASWSYNLPALTCRLLPDPSHASNTETATMTSLIVLFLNTETILVVFPGVTTLCAVFVCPKCYMFMQDGPTKKLEVK